MHNSHNSQANSPTSNTSSTESPHHSKGYDPSEEKVQKPPKRKGSREKPVNACCHKPEPEPSRSASAPVCPCVAGSAESCNRCSWGSALPAVGSSMARDSRPDEFS